MNLLSLRWPLLFCLSLLLLTPAAAPATPAGLLHVAVAGPHAAPRTKHPALPLSRLCHMLQVEHGPA